MKYLHSNLLTATNPWRNWHFVECSTSLRLFFPFCIRCLFQSCNVFLLLLLSLLKVLNDSSIQRSCEKLQSYRKNTLVYTTAHNLNSIGNSDLCITSAEEFYCAYCSHYHSSIPEFSSFPGATFIKSLGLQFWADKTSIYIFFDQ